MHKRPKRVPEDAKKAFLSFKKKENAENSAGDCLPERTSWRLWDTRFFWIVVFLLLTCKALLFRCYTSTDFEVHRNWMAVTYNLPMSEWYFNNVSQWTLDYPPFFAYFEYGLSQIAAVVDDEMLWIQSEPLMKDSVLIFQRFSVIFTDIIYIAASAIVSEVLVNLKPYQEELKLKIKFVLFCVLASNPSLIILDNIHFQYNSMMYGLLLLSVAAVFTGRPLVGALLFSVLLNFKHIYLYYVPAFVLFFITEYLLPLNEWNAVRRTFSLGLAVIAPVLASFGPFYAIGGIEGLQQIISRLFPFKRGLTHAYWAPNFWALYNVADYSLLKLLPLTGYQKYCKNVKFLKCSFDKNPGYISGLVQEFGHIVLPDIKPLMTFILILTCLTPLLFIKAKNSQQKLLLYVVASSFSFFLFGWHVHEKALVMVLIPVTLLAFLDIRYVDVFVTLAIVTPMSMFPLIFTPLEDIVKYALTARTLMCLVSLFHFGYQLSWREIVSEWNRKVFVGAVIIEMYKVLVHRSIFGDRMEFMPLMLTSVFCAQCVVGTYIDFLRTALFEGTVTTYKKEQCKKAEVIIREKMAQYAVKFDPKLVRFVAGVDISSYSLQTELAIVSYTVLRIDDLKCVYSADKVVLMRNEYIPEYLAVREGQVLADFVNEQKDKHPVDVVLIDGNGQFHSRLCGLACHVGYQTGLPTIGVAKNFTFGPMRNYGFTEKEVQNVEREFLAKLDKDNSESAAVKVKMLKAYDETLAVVKTSSKSSRLYVSIGFDIDLDAAVEIVSRVLVHSVVEPIRVSDLRSRALISSFFEGCSPGF